MKRIITVLVLIALFLTGCSNAYSVSEEGYANLTKITFTFKITDESGGEVYSNEIAYSTGSYSVYIPILEVLRDESISYSEVDGLYDDFFGVPSYNESRWVLYINDVETDFNSLAKVQDEDVVLLAFEK